eukprot:s3983_g7.t3
MRCSQFAPMFHQLGRPAVADVSPSLAPVHLLCGDTTVRGHFACPLCPRIFTFSATSVSLDVTRNSTAWLQCVPLGTTHMFHEDAPGRVRSLSLLLGLRQLQGLVLRDQRQVSGRSALRWAFQRLRRHGLREAQQAQRLPMRHVARASMASTLKSEWHQAGVLEDSEASNDDSESQDRGFAATSARCGHRWSLHGRELQRWLSGTVGCKDGRLDIMFPQPRRASHGMNSMPCSVQLGRQSFRNRCKSAILCSCSHGPRCLLAGDRTARLWEGCSIIGTSKRKAKSRWINDIIGTSQVAAILYALTSLKVMNSLPLPGQKPKEAKHLVNWRIRPGKSSEDKLERLLRSLARANIIEEHFLESEGAGVAFRHSSKSAELRDEAQWNTRELVLTHLSPSYQRAWLRLFDSLAVDPYNDQPKEGEDEPFRLEHGKGVFDFYQDPQNQEAAQAFDDLMSGFSDSDEVYDGKSGADLVTSLPVWKDLRQFKQPAQVVDLGGGQGVLLSALCKHYGFEGTVVDREDGDFFVAGIAENFPDAQVYILKWVLHDWSDERCKMILRNLREAVAVPEVEPVSSPQWPRLLVLEQVLPEDSDTSAAAKLARKELDDAGLTLGGSIIPHFCFLLGICHEFAKQYQTRRRMARERREV